RFLSSMEWRTFVESMSSVEEILRQDPLGVHVRMDFATRDEYRHVVEELARYSKKPEEDVARQAVSLAQSAVVEEGGDDRVRHVGYYLVGRGRTMLERAVGVRLSPGLLLKRFGRSFPALIYVTFIG